MAGITESGNNYLEARAHVLYMLWFQLWVFDPSTQISSHIFSRCFLIPFIFLLGLKFATGLELVYSTSSLGAFLTKVEQSGVKFGFPLSVLNLFLLSQRISL